MSTNKKLREFWVHTTSAPIVQSSGILYYAATCRISGLIHVREVLPNEKSMHDKLVEALKRAEQYMVTTNLERARSRGDLESVQSAIAKAERGE